jgi:Concanavalin A-like lectin/glucanases superfamily
MKRLMLMCVLLMVTGMAQAELVMYMNFEEDPTTQAAGYVLDQSGYANHGQVQTGWEGYSLPQYITSHDSSQAMQFGYDDTTGEGNAWNNVAVLKSDSLKNLGTMFSMSFWVKVDETSSWHEYPKILSCPNYEIDMHSSGDAASYFWPWDETWNNWDFAMANTQSYEDSWMHMAVTYDGTTFTQYINGSYAMSKDDFATQFDNGTWDLAGFTDDVLTIGTHAYGPNNSSGNGYLCGALDDVAIWGNGYLDAAGVAELYAGTEDPGTVTLIPEPATLILLSLGGMLLRRKK